MRLSLLIRLSLSLDSRESRKRCGTPYLDGELCGVRPVPRAGRQGPHRIQPAREHVVSEKFATAPMSSGCWSVLWLIAATTEADILTATTANPSSCHSLLAAVPGLVPLIGPADDRSPMGSDAPRSVRPMGATNRPVIPITVMVRIWLANGHSPIGADASGSVNSIGTSGCVDRLSEHKREKCNHDGEHRCAISDESQRSVFHFEYPLGYRSARLFHRYSTIRTPAIQPEFCPCSISRCERISRISQPASIWSAHRLL